MITIFRGFVNSKIVIMILYIFIKVYVKRVFFETNQRHSQ